jgi:transcriptional regulator with XRE-family HTH domain
MSERTSRLKSNLVRKLRRQSGKSWATIAKECEVHPGTIKRWMKGGEVLIDNIGALAKALGTTADQIMLVDGEEDETDYVEAELTLEGNLADLKQPEHVTVLLEKVQKAIGAKFRVMLMYVGEGSIKLVIKLHREDAERMVKWEPTKRLYQLGVLEIKALNHHIRMGKAARDATKAMEEDGEKAPYLAEEDSGWESEEP